MDLERSSVRAIYPGFELRAEGEGVRMAGHFAVFNQWAEIRSVFEGEFMERLAPGCFAKTFKERGRRIKVLFNHGRDPAIGDKVLGSISQLSEDRMGASYEVELIDTQYVRELLPALDKGLYGASFRFKPLKVQIDEEAKPSSHNPSGLPECTVLECSVSEFGPVTFPAYQATTAGLRGLTDELAFTALSSMDRLGQLASYSERIQRRTNPSDPRTPTVQPAGLWGVEDSAACMPDWYLRREAEQRGYHGSIA